MRNLLSGLLLFGILRLVKRKIRGVIIPRTRKELFLLDLHEYLVDNYRAEETFHLVLIQ